MCIRDSLNSVNLNAGQDFPYLCMDVENGKSVPEPPGFHVMHWHEDLSLIHISVMPSRIDVSIIPFTSGVKFNNPLSLSDETHFLSLIHI